MTAIYTISVIGSIVGDTEEESKPVKVADSVEELLCLLNEERIDVENNYLFTEKQVAHKL